MISILFILLSSLLLILSFPKPELSYFIWLGFVPFLFALENKSSKKTFLLSYLCGIIFWLGTIYWVGFITSLGCVLLILYLSLYFGIFGLFVSYIIKRSKASLIFIPSAWVFLELIRSHLFTGFGWASLGYSQYKNLSLIQIADIAGVYGVSFLIILINVCIYKTIKAILVKKKTKDLVFSIILAIFFVMAVLIYGHFRLNQQYLLKYKPLVKASILQGNFPAYEKWTESLQNKILTKYLDLTNKAGADSPDIIIWPETSVPDYLNKNKRMQDMISKQADKLDTFLLIGAPWYEARRYYNSAVLFSRQGRIINRYSKVHLVPMGEYFPFSRYFPKFADMFESGSFTAGSFHTVFDIPLKNKEYAKFCVLICYEDIFPSLVRDFINKKALFIINITDDSWFGNSGASYQHLQALVLRAVENRISAVRATNTGVSCFIKPTGQIYGKIKSDLGDDLFISGYSTQNVAIFNIDTFYQKYGDVFAWICAFISLISLLYYSYKK